MRTYPVFLCCNYRKRCPFAQHLNVPYLTLGTVAGTMWDLRDFAAVYFKPCDTAVVGEVYMLSRPQIREVERQLDVRTWRRKHGTFERRKVAVTKPDGTQIAAFGYEYVMYTEGKLRSSGVTYIQSGDWRKYRGY